ncbi:MAG: thioredoxin family protein [Rhodoferax sp.]|nr:thioredoxin family protein [Rhodoferax sp.]
MSTLHRILGAFALTVFSLSAFAQDLPAKFDPQRDAAKDVRTATALAKAQGKRVIVDVGGEWCKWCHFLDKFIDTNADVKSALDKNFVWVKVNWSPDNKNVALLSQWPKIQGYPHLFVLDADGKLLHSQNTGDLEAAEGLNTYDKPKVMAFLNQQIARK